MLAYPYKTDEIAFAKYVVLKANHSPGSGTFQIMIIMSPKMFIMYASVIAQAGDRKKSAPKQTASVMKIPIAGIVAPRLLTSGIE